MAAASALANLGRVSATVDEQLEAASWNLDPLVEGGGPEAVEAMLNEARERAEAVRGALPRPGRRAGRPAELAEAMHELADDPGPRRPRRVATRC